MRSFVCSYIESEKARREQNGDAGFSLIELIVVVVILGILAAVAIPVFLGLQGNAETSARETVAANAASQYSSKKAADEAYVFVQADFANLAAGGFTISNTGGADLDEFCIRAVKDSKYSQSGPGCTGDASGDVTGS